MNKYDRIKRVKSFGLNTENSILFTGSEEIPDRNKYSLRTQIAGDNSYSTLNTPHYPLITKKKLNELIPKLLKKGLELIIAEPIDPKHAALAGCIMREVDKYVIEIALGPGTVRRVTHEGLIDERYETHFMRPRISNVKIAEAVRKLVGMEEKHNIKIPYITEFSYYKRPVGYLKERPIFWEIHELEGGR